MTTVGILGGGQLARMMALAGAPLGLRFLVMDNVADACAGQFAPMVIGDYRDEAALAEFASRVDVATFDFENVPAESAQWLSERVSVFPNPRALAIAQDRLAEKTLFRELGIPVPQFAAIDTRESLDAAIAAIGTPCILKTRRLGYDGKGQFRLRTADDAAAAWDALGAQAATVRVGIGYGRRDAALIRRAGWTSFVMGTGFMAAMAVLMWLSPELLIALFIDRDAAVNAEVVRLAVSFLAIAALFQIVDGAQVVGAGMLRGLHDTSVPMLFAAFGYWVVGIGVGAWLAFSQGWKGVGIWVGLASGLGIVAILMLVRWSMRARLGLLPSEA